MRVAVSWLREHVALPPELTAQRLDDALTNLGIEVESIVDQGASVQGTLAVGRVLTIEELTGFRKPIRFCTVDVGKANGTGKPQEIVCGATNFVEGDLVAVILPGGVLPGGFTIGARKTYGHNSNGMICSARELGVSDDHAGIMVLDPLSGATPGQDARPYVGLGEMVLEVEITPDRGYQMSVRGLARELAYAFGVPFTDPGTATAPKGSTRGKPAWPVTVVDQVGCDRFAARLVTGLDPHAPSPQWMQRRLLAAGVRTLGLAIDVTNYVMLELGQPMHAFDANRISGALVVRRAAQGERLTTLDGVARVLSAEDMVICDDTGPISLAAVMGGQISEVVPGTTTDVLLEAAHWDPTMVSRTARRHNLFSEAAKRWERGVDRELALVAIDRAVQILVEHGGGTAGRQILDLNYPPQTATITMNSEEASRLVGMPYPTSRVAELLVEVGCEVTAQGSILTVTPPSWRPDLVRPADLVEEVVRLDGYDKVPSTLPVAPPGAGLTATQRRRRTVGRALAELGYVEVLPTPFISTDALRRLGLPTAALRLANPLSEEEPLMRTSLLPGLLATLRRNLGRGNRDVALFELGLVFLPTTDGPPPVLDVARRPTDEEWERAKAAVPSQPTHVATVAAGELAHSGWWGAGRQVDWADTIQVARDVLASAGVRPSSVRVSAAGPMPWHPGRCAAVLTDGAVIGHAGELHPAVCADLEVPKRTCALELDLSAVPFPGPTPAPALSTFPAALIDVALVVASQVPAAEVEQSLVDGAGSLLESVRLFDVYTGSQVGAGKKSLAYKLTFRAADRTLTAEEAVAARDSAVAVAAQRFQATLRGA
ncbi:MAG TPA: phenylalanine--tRNA ligase subunit beta [Micromonosporaceae bacterium]|jgi:phenylalanyl-tRNA synthetase beta chain